VLLAPVLGLQFDLAAGAGRAGAGAAARHAGAVLIGAIGAALTLGVRGGGVLLSLLVLPLYIPVLIFGAGAVEADMAGLGATAHLSLLAAAGAGGFFRPVGNDGAALRIALE
jgi:heme exporter protein B